MVDSVAMTAMSPEGEACFAQGGKRGGGGRVAGDDQQLDALADELGGGLKGIADNRFLAFGPVGHAGGVSEEQVILAGHEAAHGVKDGQAAHAGIEKANGQLVLAALFRSHQHILCPMPLYRMERSRPGRPAVRDFDLAPLGGGAHVSLRRGAPGYSSRPRP